jgi:ABC-2 type transport system ATP-binding protein
MNTIQHAVEVRNLDVQFGDFFAVKNVSFAVRVGEIFGFLGANGAGKTTTIRVLCGLLAPTRGEIEIAGQNFSCAGSELKMKVGYMSQKFTLYDDMTVEENLNFAGELHFMEAVEIKNRKEELLHFIGWQRDLKMMVKELPGGQKQQVSLLAAMMHDPEIVFLDEPTAGVSPVSRAKFWSLIRKIVSKGKTVFVTTHYMDEAEQCDRIALMRAGELVALDSPSNLKKQSFPKGLIEIDPHKNVSLKSFEELKGRNYFSMLQPHGLRFHAEWKNENSEKEARNDLQNWGKVRVIEPSLEDVFIRVVEGQDR